MPHNSLALVSIGIRNYHTGTDYREIPCSLLDAKNIYSLVEYTFYDEFNSHISYCAYDVSRGGFRDRLENMVISLREERIKTLVFYFSGHGKMKPRTQTLEFVFPDGQTESVDIIEEIFSDLDLDVILILDCCHSGLALKLADVKNGIDGGNISALCSCGAIESSLYDTKSSNFTKYFIQTIEKLDKENIDITLPSIFKSMQDIYDKCLFHISPLHVGLSLKSFSSNVDSSFVKIKLVKSICRSLPDIREIVIYSLNRFSLPVAVNVIVQLIMEKNYYDHNWLVRRALGSILSDVNTGSYIQTVDTIVDHLASSSNWMSKCVALIAKRSNEEFIKKMAAAIINDINSCMDLLWLAHLYFSDFSDLEDMIECTQCNLFKTEWGVLEIFERYYESTDSIKLYSLIKSFVKDDVLLKSVNKHLCHLGLNEDCRINDLSVNSNALTELLYTSQKRESNYKKHYNCKWDYSFFWGNWRDSISIDLLDFFENETFEVFFNQLNSAKNLPKYSHRMSIFQSLAKLEEKVFFKLEESVRWGLHDEHPWVRREALALFKNTVDTDEILDSIKSYSVDKQLYPGVLDYISELIGLGVDADKAFGITKLNKMEKRSILDYCTLF